jgi:Cu(I)/Ag(I) efflux system membrane fusion protein
MRRSARSVAIQLFAVLVVACGRGEDHPPGPEPSKAAAGSGHEGHGAPTPAGYARVDLPGEREQRFGVRTEPVRPTALVRTVRTVGIVREDERRQSTVQVKWDGWIETLHVQFVGETVQKGAPLFTVYSPDLLVAQQEYVSALRRLEVARQAVKGAGGDLETGRVLADAAREKLRFWDVPDAHVERVAKSGEAERLVTIVAPRDGTVLERPARPGLHVEPGTELYSIADLSSVWVVADLYEYEAPLVREGTEGKFQPVGPEATEIPVKVAFVAPTVDAMTRTVKVRFDVPNPDDRLRPGAYGTLRLSLELGTSLSAPADAVIDTGERRVVFVRAGIGRFEPREVKIGARAGDRVQVLEGLSEGEEVVVRGQFLLDSESRLRAAGTGQPGHGAH